MGCDGVRGVMLMMLNVDGDGPKSGGVGDEFAEPHPSLLGGHPALSDDEGPVLVPRVLCDFAELVRPKKKEAEGEPLLDGDPAACAAVCALRVDAVCGRRVAATAVPAL